jgi:hypothetical protein
MMSTVWQACGPCTVCARVSVCRCGGLVRVGDLALAKPPSLCGFELELVDTAKQKSCQSTRKIKTRNCDVTDLPTQVAAGTEALTQLHGYCRML